MTYLVLARKWRPRSFETLIGQDHVVRALTHALSTQRLHHAWLFTGTRGVGKTTLSRILAKSLNCEAGITATPCGHCQACTEIDAGRFVDYVELDAASNRGVDEMTQLLEQAVYAPSSGRFKVYMIDEVHMLTGHAFNAMLKTLEEPPPHVKFILATTDPQKIPVTVLSRCLQFNLKQMTAESIVAHLQEVLGQESMQYETPALRLLAQAASGSMRDALSLTDQAIAYSAGNLTSEAVQGMLGTIDQQHLVTLLRALAAGSAAQVLSVADELATRGLSYSGALADLAVLLSRVAIQQRIPGTIPADDPLADDIAQLGAALHPDQTQLFYSVAVHSRSELSLAPDEYAGFVMACLRMLALVPPDTTPPAEPPPGGVADTATPDSKPKPASVAQPTSRPAVPAPAQNIHKAAEPTVEPSPASMAPSLPGSQDASDVPAWEDAPKESEPSSNPESLSAERAVEPEGFETMQSHAVDEAHYEPVGMDTADFDGPPDDFQEASYVLDDMAPDDFVSDDAVPAALAGGRKKTRAPRLKSMTAQEWPALAAVLPVTGWAAELARQSEWVGVEGEQLILRVAILSREDSAGRLRLQTVLSEHFGTVIRLKIEYGSTGDETAHAVEQAQKAVRQQEAEHAVANDPFVQTLISEFGAKVVPGSISATPQTRAA
ncbi:DNA polymerase III subunit gamma/tau [Pollutimonas harenae]|uniref:DNA polymerase III subunit gamma/tau n=1 Tax=Pollutimonas harenae TaxID=657015 RepID=A0A853H8F0_9BURK|nr:DNA polymerase III subunit gamma/tau [Pollutimonas harenae]NYT86334.1 DNA polymerase III subunit gamma/tau [Pollutimonas harenae]TEA69908.1 DNA polymerase III subunit gamma/tau [Pollutimonas harenae]